MTSTPRLLLVLVWVVGAAVATSIGLLAVRQVASQVGDPAVPVLAGGGPASAPVSPSPPAGSPDPGRSSAPASAVTSASFRSTGGTVGVQCSGRTPALLYATPADGYALDERSVEGGELEVRFEAGERRVRLTVSCAAGRPQLTDERVDDD